MGYESRVAVVGRLRTWKVLGCAALVAAGCTNVNMPAALGDLSSSVTDALAVKVPFVTPARNADASLLKSMVVVPGSGANAQQLAGSVEAAMLKLRVGERPVYANVRLEAPRALSLAESQLLSIGKQAGTQGALGVTAVSTDLSSASVQEDRSSCSVETRGLRTCPRDKTVQRKVTCTETRANASAQVRVVRVADGRTVLTDKLGGIAISKSCPDDTVAAADRNQLLGAALSDLVNNILKQVAPTVEMRPLDMRPADDKLPADKRKPFDAALEFARGKRMDESCARFLELYDDFKESVALTYNVGFCHESHGDLLKASQTYKHASELLNAPDGQIDRRLAAVGKAINDNPYAALGGLQSTPMTKAQYVAAASEGRRVALVVGNARYEKGALINPVNDAQLVTRRLRDIGFDVTLVENANGARLKNAVLDFSQRAKDAGVALFFYAGHAIQDQGENLLLPVDNKAMKTTEDVRDKGGLALASLQAHLDGARPRVKLIVLDACRDNPLPAASRGLGGGGLAGMTPAEGTLIAFSTSPGKTAEDGNGKNSIFTRHFVDQLGKPNQTLEQLFKQVRSQVRNETFNKQEPMEINALVGDVVLVKK